VTTAKQSTDTTLRSSYAAHAHFESGPLGANRWKSQHLNMDRSQTYSCMYRIETTESSEGQLICWFSSMVENTKNIRCYSINKCVHVTWLE